MSKRTLTLWSSAAILLCSAGAAIAGPGSDVIVGDIHEVQNNGQSGGMVSWSLGTVSCNKGDVPFQWLTSSNGAAAGTGENRHPVIGQNLFKVTTGANGTIRQLSQSWLKHGFTALQGNVCGFGCVAHPNGTYLGVGCSDPYSASLNAGQPNAGPKWEVNASNGVFPFPPFGKNTLTGNADKRLQVAPAQITAGALYFGECQYVAQDDATNNNKNNNASYRRVTIATTSPYSMDEVDSTVRERPGIYTWKDHGLGLNTPDANVLISPIDVPGDGRFLLAVKVTQTSATVWHYEYAIHNLNSNRSGQQFRINFPAGTTITNAGFYNVPYHSGEPHSNTPWTIAVGSDNITWSGPTYSGTPMTQTGPTTWVQPTGNDVTANALRWGTMYNFWFDANVGPTTADAPKGGTQLALFRPGSFGNAIQIAAPTPGSLTVAAPFNDNCASPTPIGDGAWAFSTAGATSAGPNECTSSGNAEINQDIWYIYTAGASGNVTVSTCGSEYDTRLAIYSACPTAAGTAIACNDDFNCDGSGADELQSRVTFAAVGGQTYLIRVGGYTNEYGNGTLTVSGPTTLGACCTTSGCSVTTELGCTGSFEGLGTSCTPSPCPGPANDSCANPIILSDGVPVSGTTIGATDDGTSSCGSSASSPDVWFAYTPLTTGNVVFSTCGATNYDSVLSVHTACPVGSTSNQIAAGGCDDDGCGTTGGPASRQANLTAGIRYLIRVTGFNGDTGAFTLLTTGGGGVAPPINDDCSGRIGVNAGVYAISNTGATTDGPAHATCSSRSQTQITKDLWYNFPATANGTLTVQVCAAAGSTIDPWVAIYDGYGCTDFATRLMGCNDQGNACSATNNAIITVPVVNTVSYTIRVGSYNNTAGNANMTITFTPTTGACCDSGTGCHLVATAADCTMSGGTYLGDNTLCVPDPCVPVTGACCVGTTCSVTTSAACTGTYHGNGSTCEGSALNPITCCPANVNGADGVSADDIFAFLDMWFVQNGNTGPGHAADFNDNEAVNADDIFAFLDAWFAGCD